MSVSLAIGLIRPPGPLEWFVDVNPISGAGDGVRSLMAGTPVGTASGGLSRSATAGAVVVAGAAGRRAVDGGRTAQVQCVAG